MNIHHSRKNSGFTLIELLVVISIIAILAAILFPVFARARENARRASCMSNMKQLGLGFLQHAQDYDERYPNNYNGGPAYNPWTGLIYPYVKSQAVYVCPSDSSTASPKVSYGYNHNNSFNLIAFSIQSVRTLSSFTAPARTVMLWEAGGQTIDVTNPTAASFELWGNCFYGTHGSYATGGMDGCDFSGTLGAPGRHLGGSNFLAADGHVKWMRPEKVSGGRDANAGNDVSSQSCNGNSQSAQNTASICAEGTEYSGAGAHALTFSTK